ncbi:MAG: hypothetical protein WC007_17695 [Pelobacteraceae bacterium]
MFNHGKILRLAWTAVLALLIHGVFSCVVAAAAEESELVGPPQPEAPKQEEKTLKETLVNIEKRVDVAHDKLEQDILAMVTRLDNFFGSVQTENLRKTSYEFRWRNGIRIDEGGKFKPDINVRANIVLPKTSEKLRLFISGENQLETPSPSLPSDPGNPGFDRSTRPSAKIVNTEFRYSLFAAPDQDLFLGAGVKVALPLEPFVRSRYQFIHTINNLFLIRLGETVFVKYSVGVGETTEVSLERVLDAKSLLRLANSATLSQEFSGLEWGSELSLIRELTAKSAITFTGGIYGNSTPDTVATNYRLLTRYRQSFLRDWLFYEVEPELSWPRQPGGVYAPKYAVTFRLEVLFQN